jgi:NAD-dependent deacetylase
MDDIEKLLDFFRNTKRWVAFTGAGISAESGIPTYRGTGGALWSKYDPDKYARIDSFLQEPVYYWSFFRDERYPQLKSSQPNLAHQTLAYWETLDKLQCVITQNIDGLHRAAGSQHIIELHGNAQRIHCLNCYKQITPDQAYELLMAKMPPTCPDCGGVIRPDVVFFGETLPEGALDQAYEEVGKCDLLLSIGSSLVVYPAADLPRHAVDSGATLIIINRDPTPLDFLADAVIHEPAGEVLPQLSEALGL